MVTLKEGDKAPAFKGIDQNGNTVSSVEHKGKKLVLFFYSEDDSPTCTIEACNLRDNYALLKQHGFEVIGVSPDDENSHKKFEAKYKLPYTLIADTKHTILEKYGVWDQKQMFGRKQFSQFHLRYNLPIRRNDIKIDCRVTIYFLNCKVCI